MKGRLLFACVVCLAPAALDRGRGDLAAALPDRPGVKRLRVLVPDLWEGEQSAVVRLRKLAFDVVVVPWKELDPDRLEDVDVIFLPTQWAERADHFKHFEAKKDAFRGFVERGGGLLVCQPNPLAQGTCTPGLLPYPITFQNHYDDRNPERVNLAPDHFITDDLPGSDMPFPADPMIKVDGRYHVLAKQKSTGWPSLAVCPFGDGRVVVQTANESPQATIPFGDELLRRMVVWAAGRERPR
jgi:hypothetical protein